MLIHVIIDNIVVAYTLINIGYLTYRIILLKFIKKSNLKYKRVTLQQIIGVAGKESYINKAIRF